ncbi:MAG: hypothetical protein JWR61_4324 [Ferruginibacter sp.]|nr:hypothetical protein [Ferruginibacter sp.]
MAVAVITGTTMIMTEGTGNTTETSKNEPPLAGAFLLYLRTKINTVNQCTKQFL